MGCVLENVGRVVPHDAANIALIEGGSVRLSYVRGLSNEYDGLYQNLRLPLGLPGFQAMVQTQ